MNEQEGNIISNQKEEKVQVYENDDAYLFGEELSGNDSLEVGYKNSFNENKNKIINQKELLNKFNTNLSQDDELDQEQELEQEKNQNEKIIDNTNNIFDNENILNNNNIKNNSFKDQKYMINDINSDMENEEGGEGGYDEENKDNQENGNFINENENNNINDNFIINNNINKSNHNSNNNIEQNKILNQKNNVNNINVNVNDNQNEELDENENENENESDSGVPLVTLNFLSICQCCKNSFNSKENIPYLFKCGHFFCKQCIIEQFTDEEGIKCPNDGLVANSISDLKILNNFITDKTVTQRTSSPFSSPEAPGVEKNKFNSKISKNKNNKEIKNIENIQNSEYKCCEFHKGQKLTHFIEETKELICVYCAFERFKQNQGMEIKEINDKCKDMESEMDSVIEENQYNVGIIQTSLKEIKKNKENEEKKINEIFDRFIELIKSKKEEYINKIDNLFTNNAEKLSQKLELFSNKIEKSECVKEKINLFLNNQDTSQFLQLYEYYNKIKMELQSVHSLKLNLQKYNFNYEDEMAISRMISKFGEIKLTPKIFTFIGETVKDDKDSINDSNNFNKIKKFDGIKVKLNNNNNYNNLNLNNDNINDENNFEKYNNNIINNNMNYQTTFPIPKYNNINNDNADNRDNLLPKNKSSINFYKKSLNINNNINTKTYQIGNYQKKNLNTNQNKYIDYSNQMDNRNIHYNKNIENNNLINYDKYSIPKNINNDILNKGRNSSLNEGIRLNTPNSLSKVYHNCMNNNNNLIIKNNFYNNTNNNSLGKKINKNKINLTQVKNNRNTKCKNNKKNSLQFKYNSNLNCDNYKNKSYTFLTK